MSEGSDKIEGMIERLGRLDAEATKDWMSHGSACDVPGKRRPLAKMIRGTKPIGMTISTPNTAQAPEHIDAMLACEARNALPTLLALARLAVEARRWIYDADAHAEANGTGQTRRWIETFDALAREMEAT